MKILGCDLHAKQQTIAMVDTETGEFTGSSPRPGGLLLTEVAKSRSNIDPRGAVGRKNPT